MRNIEEIEIGPAQNLGCGCGAQVVRERFAQRDETRIPVLEVNIIGYVFQESRDECTVDETGAFVRGTDGKVGLHFANAQEGGNSDGVGSDGTYRANTARSAS